MRPPPSQTRSPMAATLDLWEQQATPEPESPPTAAPPGWGWREVARNAAWRVRAATIALWVMIALAAAGGLRSLIGAPAQEAPAGSAQPPAGAAGFAEQYVAAYLEAGAGDEAALAPFYPGPVDLTGVTPSARYVSLAAVVAAAPIGPEYWAITVAADVLDQVAGGYEQGGTSYYRVGVRAYDRTDVATSLPSLVPAPKPGALPALAVPLPASPASAALGATLAAFFTRYLAGAGPPPASVTVTSVGLGPARAGPPVSRVAAVTVLSTDGAGRAQLLGYTVRLSGSPAGWLVRAVLPAPPPRP